MTPDNEAKGGARPPDSIHGNERADAPESPVVQLPSDPAPSNIGLYVVLACFLALFFGALLVHREVQSDLVKAVAWPMCAAFLISKLPGREAVKLIRSSRLFHR